MTEGQNYFSNLLEVRRLNEFRHREMHAVEPLLNARTFFHECEITTGKMKTYCLVLVKI
jgi:hypothetical protein